MKFRTSLSRLGTFSFSFSILILILVARLAVFSIQG